MKLGEVVIHMDHQVSWKSDEKPKVLLIAHFSVQNFKVSVDS